MTWQAHEGAWNVLGQNFRVPACIRAWAIVIFDDKVTDAAIRLASALRASMEKLGESRFASLYTPQWTESMARASVSLCRFPIGISPHPSLFPLAFREPNPAIRRGDPQNVLRVRRMYVCRSATCNGYVCVRV